MKTANLPQTIQASLPDPVLLDAARSYAANSRAEATRRAYRSDWEGFSAWCEGRGRPAMPASPETVALYLSDLADVRKPSTLARKSAAISVAHQSAGHPSPCSSVLVHSVMSGIRRAKGTAQTKKAPVRVAHLRKGLETLPDNQLGMRDRALLLIGYAGGFRRSELSALDVSDVEFVPEGVTITVRRSKTDQEGRGMKKAIPYGSRSDTCPVKALRAYLDETGIAEGPLFRRAVKGGRVTRERMGGRSVADAVKRLAPAMGLDAAQVGGHSMRAGLVTDAYAAGVPEAVIMAQTGHRSHQVMGGYRREANLFKQNAAASVGL